MGATLVFENRLPVPLVAAGSVIGTIAALVLLFQLFKYLKNHLLWRVRNRIVGSFIFVGLIPLLLILGTVFLVGYILAGQLASVFVEDAVASLARELSWINLELRDRLRAGGEESFQQQASGVFSSRVDAFPSLAAHLVAPGDGESFDITQLYDPKGIAGEIEHFQVNKWIGDTSYYEGFIKEGKTTLLAAINPVSESGPYLIVSAPLDGNLERRLRDDYDIYAVLIGSGGTSVNITESSITVTTNNEKGEVRDEELEKHIEATAEWANEDPRRMISWAAFLVGGDSGSIKQDFAALAIMHVPLQSVYSAYVAKHSELGRVLLLFAGILLGLFLFAELVSVVIGVAISRRITRSVHDMYKGTQALRSGNLQAAMRSQLVSIKQTSTERLEESLSEIMSKLNNQIYRSSPSAKYATLFFGRYDAESRELCYCNAGHLPPLLIRNGSAERLEVGGTVIGLFEQAAYQANTVRLAPDTVFAIFTDGVTEAPNCQDEEFGEDRLIDILCEIRTQPVAAIYDAVMEQVKEWQGEQKQHDDITLIVGKVG